MDVCHCRNLPALALLVALAWPGRLDAQQPPRPERTAVARCIKHMQDVVEGRDPVRANHARGVMIGEYFWAPVALLPRKICVADVDFRGYRRSGRDMNALLRAVARYHRAKLRACDKLRRGQGNSRLTLKINRKGTVTSWRATGDKGLLPATRCLGRSFASGPFLHPDADTRATFHMELGFLVEPLPRAKEPRAPRAPAHDGNH